MRRAGFLTGGNLHIPGREWADLGERRDCGMDLFCGASAEENLEMSQYFHTLPIYVQTALQEGGMSFTNLKDLKACAENLEA